MRNCRFFRGSFINTESCVKASAPKFDDTFLKPAHNNRNWMCQKVVQLLHVNPTGQSHQNENCEIKKITGVKTWVENETHQRATFEAREEDSSNTTNSCFRRQRCAPIEQAEDRYCANSTTNQKKTVEPYMQV